MPPGDAAASGPLPSGHLCAQHFSPWHRSTRGATGPRSGRALPRASRTRAQELIEAGLVLVEGRAAKGASRVRDGQRMSVEEQPRPPMTAHAEQIPIDVLYEDDDVIVINKAAGMTVHAGAENPSGTLVNALLGRGQGLSQSSTYCARASCTAWTRTPPAPFWWPRTISRTPKWLKIFASGW